MYKAVKQVCGTCQNVDRRAYPGEMVCYKKNPDVQQAVRVKENQQCTRWRGR
ncbi:MAG: hypothetical protein H6Q72_4780 [Firmicutes bacterium]|nr:hypothetical protein [Bacillota bacterium]